MKANLWSEVERLVHEAMQLSPGERQGFAANISNAEIREEVLSLLATGETDTRSIYGVIAEAARIIGNEPLTGRHFSHFQVIREIGRGGMGEVYLAVDLNLRRNVALKLLPVAFQEDRQRVHWFEREARAAAALSHPNIVTVYEIGNWAGQRFIAAEFVEGETLAQRLRRGPLTVQQTLLVGKQIAEALAVAHNAGIIHGDLKPANVMLRPDGAIKVLDFGLARITQRVGETEETETATAVGQVCGTPAYMSPEQVRGEKAEAASDLWSFGVLLYETFAGGRPFEGKANADIVAGILAGEPAPLRSINRNIPPEVERLVARLLMKQREQRCCSAAEIAREMNRLSSSATDTKAPRRRPRLAEAAVLASLVLLAAGGWLIHRSSRRDWARNEAIPQARALAGKGDYAAAYRLALEAAHYISQEPALRQLLSEVSRSFSVHSNPSGAEVAWKPYAGSKSSWQPLGRTPLENVRFPGGSLRLRLTMPGYESQEVGVGEYAPAGAYKLELKRAGASPNDMVWVPEGPEQLQIRGIGEVRLPRLDGFLIDRYEVTNKQFKKFINNGGYSKRDYWKAPFMKDGHTVPWDQALQRFVDATGQPGPANWEAGMYSDGQEDYPVTGISWYEAAAYAEFARKSLPTVYHWLRAADPNGSSFQVALSNFGGVHLMPVGRSGAVGLYGAYDMAGNAREWCWNESGGRRFILGGSWADPDYMFVRGQTLSPWDRSGTNGFRCVLNPNASSGKAAEPLAPYHPPDYVRMKPVPDEVFAFYKRLYAHERTPLDSVVESTDETPDLWRREKIQFNAAYGHERMTAYLFLPKMGKPPYQCVIYYPGSSTIRRVSGETIRPESYILRSGRAMLYPIYKGTYERYLSTATNDPIQVRDQAIWASKDLGQSIDYLQTRKDIDSGKLAYLGVSWGSEIAPILLAIEDRLKTAVLLSGGMSSFYGALPEINAVNFLRRIKIPVLMVNGRYDSILPVETAQDPMFQLLGTAAPDKRHVMLASGHSVNAPEVRNGMIREVLSWLDRYLGKT